jgi:glycosyltransferase involved in cell wall biosynthesis
VNESQSKRAIIVGKLPPPYFGPAIATEIILKSKLNDHYKLEHIDTRLNKDMQTMGKFSFGKILKTFVIYSNYIKLLRQKDVSLVLIPIAQETSGLLKDSILISLGKIYKKKVIIHLRGSSLLTWYKRKNRIVRSFFRSQFSKVDGAIVLGESLRYIFEPFLPKEKIYVVPNGANISFPTKNSESTKIKLLYFANLMSNKGVDILLSAIKELPTEITSKIVCNVTGRWKNEEYRKLCTDIVSENNLPVIFEAPKSGVEKFSQFINADIFIFPPRAPEGHPWVIVEAMAAGLPIITTDQGAIKECVLHCENGFIVTTNSHQEIKQRLIELIQDSKLRERMGSKSKSLYEQKFTEDQMVLNLKKVFDSVLQKSN